MIHVDLTGGAPIAQAALKCLLDKLVPSDLRDFSVEYSHVQTHRQAGCYHGGERRVVININHPKCKGNLKVITGVAIHELAHHVTFFPKADDRKAFNRGGACHGAQFYIALGRLVQRADDAGVEAVIEYDTDI